MLCLIFIFFFQAEDGIRDAHYLLEFRRVLFRSLALWQFMPHFLRFVTLAALTFLLTRYISLEQVAFTYAGASLVVVGVGILYLWQMYHAHFNLSGHGEKIGRAHV